MTDAGSAFDRLDQFGQDHADGADGVVIAGDRVVDQLGVAIGVDDGHHGDAEAVGFADSDILARRVDHDQRGGEFVHFAETGQILHQAGQLAAEGSLLFFTDLGEPGALELLLDLVETSHTFADRGKIRQRSAQPAVMDVELSARLGGIFDRFLCLLFAADEKDLPAPGHDTGEELRRGVELLDRAADVDDVDVVFLFEDELPHLGVPALGLVSVVDAGFEEFVDQFDGCHVLVSAVGLAGFFFALGCGG